MRTLLPLVFVAIVIGCAGDEIHRVECFDGKCDGVGPDGVECRLAFGAEDIVDTNDHGTNDTLDSAELLPDMSSRTILTVRSGLYPIEDVDWYEVAMFEGLLSLRPTIKRDASTAEICAFFVGRDGVNRGRCGDDSKPIRDSGLRGCCATRVGQFTIEDIGKAFHDDSGFLYIRVKDARNDDVCIAADFKIASTPLSFD